MWCLRRRSAPGRLVRALKPGGSGFEPPRIPWHFHSKTRVVNICNDWKTLNKTVSASQDFGNESLYQSSGADAA